MNAPPPHHAHSNRRALSAGAVQRLWRRPAWLVAFALGVHLWASALCLAQMLSAASLGQICSTASTQGRAAAGSLPGEPAGAHGLDGCEQCVASLAAAAPGPTPEAFALLPRDRAPRPAQAPLARASRTAWRPPPRGPPRTA